MAKLHIEGKGFHKNSDGSWGTDPGDEKIIASIFKGIVDIIKLFGKNK